MARASSSTLLNKLFLILAMGLWTLHNMGASAVSFTEPSLEFCVFRIFPPNKNATIASIYPVNQQPPPAPQPVGTPLVTVADNIIRETASALSRQIGSERLIRVSGFTAEDQARGQVTAVLDFRTKERNGTLSYAGMQSAGAGAPLVEELAITGGTGMYRSANGIAKVTLTSDVGGMVTRCWKVYLCKEDPLCIAPKLVH